MDKIYTVILFIGVCSCAEAIYCRHGESITACIRRSSYEYVFTTNHAQTQNSFERRPMASHKQSERQHFIPQTIPQLGVQNNGHFSQSRHPLNPSSILTFPTKQTETFMIHQDNNYIPSQYFSDASLSNLLSWPPHTPKHPHVLEYLFARPMSQLLGLKSPLHQLNKLPNQKESSETINVHAKNVFLNLNSNRVRPPSVFDSPEPLGSTAAHPPISLMAIFSKPENPYIYHSYLEALSNRPDEYFGAHEENSFVINPLLKVLFKFLKDQSKDGTFQHTKYVSLPLPPNMKPTESRWLLEPATSEPLKELSASNNSGKASLAVDTETKNTSGGNFYPFLRIDEYFATHENRTVADICQLPMGSGGCFAPSYLFYFNFAKKRCEIFVYGGCGGNENAFATFDECINACSRHMEKPQDICLLEYKSFAGCGPFDQFDGVTDSPGYYFDTETRNCTKQRLDCGWTSLGFRTPNRFRTLQECLSTCSHNIIPVGNGSHYPSNQPTRDYQLNPFSTTLQISPNTVTTEQPRKN